MVPLPLEAAAPPKALFERVRARIAVWEMLFEAPPFVLSLIANGYQGPAASGSPLNAALLHGQFSAGLARLQGPEQERYWHEVLVPKRLASGAWLVLPLEAAECTCRMFLTPKKTPHEFRDVHDLRQVNRGVFRRGFAWKICRRWQ